MKVATVINEDQKVAVRAGIGDNVVLSDLSSGEELRYMIVNPRETDPLKGKISSASPIGKAVVGRREGDIIDVTVPAGKVRYKVTRVQH